MVLAKEDYCTPDSSYAEAGSAPNNSSLRPINRPKSQTKKMRFFPKAVATCLLAMGFFLVGIALTVYYIYPTRLGYQVVKLEQEVAALERQKEYLELEVARATSLERIENLAVNELAMLPCPEIGAYIVRAPNPPPINQIASIPKEEENPVMQTIARVIIGGPMVTSGQ